MGKGFGSYQHVTESVFQAIGDKFKAIVGDDNSSGSSSRPPLLNVPELAQPAISREPPSPGQALVNYTEQVPKEIKRGIGGLLEIIGL